jgi:hypothetical protein
MPFFVKRKPCRTIVEQFARALHLIYAAAPRERHMASKLSAKLSYAAVVFALSFATAISATRAAEPNTCAAGSLSGAPCSSETIFLTTGYLSLPYKLLDSEKPFETIQIGNSKIVDVKVLSDRSFTLNPLARGDTNIIFLDGANVPIKNISVVVTDAGLNMSKEVVGVDGFMWALIIMAVAAVGVGWMAQSWKRRTGAAWAIVTFLFMFAVYFGLCFSTYLTDPRLFDKDAGWAATGIIATILSGGLLTVIIATLPKRN